MLSDAMSTATFLEHDHDSFKEYLLPKADVISRESQDAKLLGRTGA